MANVTKGIDGVVKVVVGASVVVVFVVVGATVDAAAPPPHAQHASLAVIPPQAKSPP